ncbi:MAG: RnfABCDGE type electron transport complex subunit D [Clostridiales bacterium]|nr:RnfABCDGE type electron transport complex subunit D [Clostridiales bacterium]
MEKLLRVSSSPHIRSKETVSSIMRDVVIALIPATLAGIYFFGMNAAIIVAISIISAVATEAAMQSLRKKPITINDWSAVVTGLLLAMNLPASAPWWIPIIGAIFAIAIVKHAFGGLGSNFMNPALAARAFLVTSWPIEMTTWLAPGADAVTAATPLGLIKEGGTAQLPSLMNAVLGNIGGSLGETSALLLILGGIYLLYRGVISVRIPAFYIGTVFILTFLLGGFDIFNSFYAIFVGGLMLGAIYMATDYSSSPITPKGQIIFAVGAGLLTTLIRFYGGYPEGVQFSILLMNIATPIIERYTAPKVFGGVKK